MGDSLQAGWLCELLLEQGPACGWALDRSLRFHQLFGDSHLVFGRPSAELRGLKLSEALPAGEDQVWRQRAERVFCGEKLLFREKHSSRLFSVAMYPVRDAGAIAWAGGWALDITPLGAAEQKMRNTALSALNAQEAERARLARILHDEVGQGLSAAGLQLDLLRMDLEDQVPSISTRTAEVQQLLEQLMQRVREFSYELNPATVERNGLFAALDRLVGRIRREFPGTVRLMADSSLRLPPGLAIAFYKIAHEAVENAIRHSGCTALQVQVKSTRQGPALEVRDNGKGFDPAEAAGCRLGLGMLIMQHCAEEAGLALSINSNGTQGTVIRAVSIAALPGGEN